MDTPEPVRGPGREPIPQGVRLAVPGVGSRHVLDTTSDVLVNAEFVEIV
jgi:hypothetical protein